MKTIRNEFELLDYKAENYLKFLLSKYDVRHFKLNQELSFDAVRYLSEADEIGCLCNRLTNHLFNRNWLFPIDIQDLLLPYCNFLYGTTAENIIANQSILAKYRIRIAEMTDKVWLLERYKHNCLELENYFKVNSL